MVIRMCSDSEPSIQRLKPDWSSSCSQVLNNQDMLFNNSSQFLQNGFLKIPVEYLSRPLLIHIVEDLLIHSLGNDMQMKSPSLTVEEPASDKSELVSVLTTDHLSVSKIDARYQKLEVSRESTIAGRKMKICRYCQKRHVWGKTLCSSYGKRCSHCNVLNQSEKACFWKHPELFELNNRHFVQRTPKGNVIEQPNEGKISEGVNSAPRNSENYTEVSRNLP